MPSRESPGRAWWLAAGAAASLALHGAVLAALLLWPVTEPQPEPPAEGAVALVFADIVDPGGAAAEDPAPPEPPAPPPPPMAAAPPPPPPAPPVAAPDAGPPVEAGILPPPAPAPPEPPSAPVPVAEPMPAPPGDPAPAPPASPAPVAEAPLPLPPAPAPVQAAANAAPRPPRPARPQPAPGQLRLDAGIGALPDPSFGAQAMGAVVPPGTDAGQRNAPPGYPAESRRRGEEGVVRLALRVGSDGRVESAEVATSSGFARLDQAAVEAARQWRFRPAMQAGQPVAATLPTAVHFRLTEARGR